MVKMMEREETTLEGTVRDVKRPAVTAVTGGKAAAGALLKETDDRRIIANYKTYFRRRVLILVALGVAVVLLAMVSLAAGSSGMTIPQLLKTLFGQGAKREQIILFDIRMPRVLTAILVGAILAISGAVMQCVLRNPLASASTLGVSQGAAFGATIAIVVFGAGAQYASSNAHAIAISSPYLVTLCAFAGGSISAVIVLVLARMRRVTPEALVLAGVALSSLFGGGTTLIQYFAKDVEVAAVVFWTFGDLGRTNSRELWILLATFLLTTVYFMFNRWNYNALNSGRNAAKSLGVSVDRLIHYSMVVSALSAAVAVSFVGIVSFVGLIAPHVLRRFIGNDHRLLIPGSALGGAVLLLLADLVARLIVSPVILPIGAITSFLGAPMFLYLLFRATRRS